MNQKKTSNKKARGTKSSAKVKDLKPKKNPKGGGMIKSVEISNLKAGISSPASKLGLAG